MNHHRLGISAAVLASAVYFILVAPLSDLDQWRIEREAAQRSIYSIAQKEGTTFTAVQNQLFNDCGGPANIDCVFAAARRAAPEPFWLEIAKIAFFLALGGILFASLSYLVGRWFLPIFTYAGRWFRTWLKWVSGP